ncbi:hypothetical protein [Candidatus Leptofilum sp.]|uniref:hypothetical protein n=1 Tax=Candidatus Leptofilum sp. TaxID=3241576 RepID=UPI003B595775
MSEPEKTLNPKEEIKKLSPSKKVNVGDGIQIQGDSISGDKISVGNISGSSGLAIGSGAYVVVHHGNDTSKINLTDYMQQFIDQENLPPEDKENLIAGITQIQENISLHDGSNSGLLNFFFRYIKSISPSVFDILGNRILTQENISPDVKRLVKGIL